MPNIDQVWWWAHRSGHGKLRAAAPERSLPDKMPK